ncbi:hypothetical protein ABPG72_018808 [Tetrahymena utriculariae]
MIDESLEYSAKQYLDFLTTTKDLKPRIINLESREFKMLIKFLESYCEESKSLCVRHSQNIYYLNLICQSKFKGRQEYETLPIHKNNNQRTSSEKILEIAKQYNKYSEYNGQINVDNQAQIFSNKFIQNQKENDNDRKQYQMEQDFDSFQIQNTKFNTSDYNEDLIYKVRYDQVRIKKDYYLLFDDFDTFKEDIIRKIKQIEKKQQQLKNMINAITISKKIYSQESQFSDSQVSKDELQRIPSQNIQIINQQSNNQPKKSNFKAGYPESSTLQIEKTLKFNKKQVKVKENTHSDQSSSDTNSLNQIELNQDVNKSNLKKILLQIKVLQILIVQIKQNQKVKKREKQSQKRNKLLQLFLKTLLKAHLKKYTTLFWIVKVKKANVQKNYYHKFRFQIE